MRKEGKSWDEKIGCPYLELGGQHGVQWRCGLYLRETPEVKKAMEEDMGIGMGCSSSLWNTDREEMIQKLSRLNSSSPSREP